MKPNILIIMALVLFTVVLAGCYKDILSPGQDPTAPPQDVSFSGDLVPLLVANCATAGCHDAAPAHKPSLTADKAFNAITGGGYVNTLVPASSIIYGEVKSGSMPPAGALKPSDIQKLLDWIRNGAPDN
jgi:hypothetical protein